MQSEFHQSSPNDSRMGPQSQFLDRVPDIPVACREGYAQCEGASDSVHRQTLRTSSCATETSAQKTVENSQVQCLVVDVPENMQRQAPAVSGRCFRPTSSSTKPWMVSERVFAVFSSIFRTPSGWTGVPMFQPSSAHSSACSKVREVPESPGVVLQVTRHTLPIKS